MKLWLIIIAIVLQVDFSILAWIELHRLRNEQTLTHTEQIRALHEIDRDALGLLRAQPPPSPDGRSL